MVLALLVAAAAGATSDPAAAAPMFADPALVAALGDLKATPGAWAEYLVRDPGKGDLRVRATALEAEGAGKYWLELASASETGIASAARLLIRSGAFSPGNVERLYVMVLGQQPIEVPAEHVHAAEAGPAAKATPAVKRVRAERIRVPAGEFTAQVFAVSGTRVWRAAIVPLWGLVRARSAGRSIELVAFGTQGGRSMFPPGWSQGNGSESKK
jgi:hypothetical protein